MARRGGGAVTATLTTGRDVGVQITDRDLARLRHIARWYCITPAHLYRWEHGITNALNHVTRTGGADTSYLSNIRRRLSYLASIQQSSSGTGPLVNITEIIGQAIAYNTTNAGASLADIPWQLPPTVNPGNARHAFEAADIGLHLETLGAHVLSERELSSNSDINGDTPPVTLISEYHAESGATTTKKPDLAVTADNGDFIAVEIERMRARPLKVYREKLEAYRRNPAIRAIWYLSDNDATLRRVAAAARSVFRTDTLTPDRTGVALRFGRMDEHDGWFTLPGVTADGEAATEIGAALVDDLNALAHIGDNAPATITTTHPAPAPVKEHSTVNAPPPPAVKEPAPETKPALPPLREPAPKTTNLPPLRTPEPTPQHTVNLPPLRK